MSDFILTPEDDAEIERIITDTDHEGDFVFNGEDSLWEDDAAETLVTAARRVRNYIKLRREGKTVSEARMGDINA